MLRDCRSSCGSSLLACCRWWWALHPATPAGTGLLEQDEQLLAGAGEALSRNQRHAVVYRIGQKQLARAYLVQAKQLLQQQMAHLQRLQQQ